MSDLYRWTITDVSRDVHVDSLELGPADVKGELSGFSVRKRTLHGGLREGVEVVEVDNGVTKFVVLLTRGMGLWRVESKGTVLGWKSPVQGPVHPQFVNLAEGSGLGWLAGFDEFLCRCGLDSNGGPDADASGRWVRTLHGRIANLPAHKVEITIDTKRGEIAVIGEVDEARLYHPKLRLTSTVRTRIGEKGLRIDDQVTNLSAEPTDLQLLYHINFGAPLVHEGSSVVVPFKTMIPATPRSAENITIWHKYPAPAAGYTEQVYFFELLGDAQGQTQTLLRNADGTRGASLHFGLEQLPWFTIWKSTQMPSDGCVTGLEPAINLPTTKSFEASRGRVPRLKPREEREFHLGIEIHDSPQSVADAEAHISHLQSQAASKVYQKPTLPWAPE